MKTKKVFIIERVFVYLVNLVFLPVTLVYFFFYSFFCIFNYLIEKRDTFMEYISHKLFLHCDEKDNVKNKYIYDRMSVIALYQWLKENNKI